MTDIYQSPGDRLRFEILLKSLTEGSINLAVLSDHDLVLDYYGNLFEESLRAKGESHIEWCSSTNSEKLVQKFNEILSEITLDQALEKDKKHAPRRFLLFRDSILMQDFELQLLARLVNGFPAGNISVILLMNRAASYKSKLEAFGKNILQWNVETEAGDAKTKLTDWVATEPEPEPDLIEPTLLFTPPTLSQEVPSVSKLLNIPKKTAWRVPGFGKKQETHANVETLTVNSIEKSSTPAVRATEESERATAVPELTVDTSREPKLGLLDAPMITASATDADLFKRPAKKSYAGWVLLVLVMSIAIFCLMYKDLVLEEFESLKKYLLRGTPAVAVATEEDAAHTDSSPKTLSSPEAMASEAMSSSSEPSPATSTASSASVVAVDTNSVTATATVPTKPASSSESTVESKVEIKTDTDSDVAWVNLLTPSSYVVQLAAMDTQDEMRNFQRSNAALAKARILRARQKESGKRYFILIAGPFDTKAEAEVFMQSSPLLSKGWLRSSKSMKTQFSKP